MAQIPAEKSYFSFAKGLNTDASPLGYPEETTQDEQNFEILLDGSRKRRRGIALESGGAIYASGSSLADGDVTTTYKWRNAGGLGDNFIVVQLSSDLHFFADSTTPSTDIHSTVIDLTSLQTAGNDLDVSQNPVSMSVGRNRLIVVGKYLNPFYVEWDGTSFTITNIPILERDFVGINDGVADHIQPTGTITAAHKYNLFVRGWKQANISTYFSAKSRQPSKSMWPWKGYRRTTVGGIAEADGTWGFSADKAEAELFGTDSAATGHLIVNPFDTELAGAPNLVLVEGVSIGTPSGFAATWTITSTTHGLSNGNEVVFLGTTVSGTYAGSPIVYTLPTTPFTISGVTANTFNITSIGITSEVLEEAGYYSLATANDVAINPEPFTTDERPQITAWYAGRAWYMGIADAKLADKIYFSQLVDDENKLGRCYQAADPTNAEFNELAPTDGGYITIPDLGVPKGAVVFGNSLLIFTTRGIWEISGRNGSFEADNFSVRQISEAAASSPYSIVKVESTVYWTGPEGIFKLFQDPQTGFLTTQNLTENRLSTLWNGLTTITDRQVGVKSAYDHSKKRVYFLYESPGTLVLDTILVYDIRLDAFYKLYCNQGIDNQALIGLFSITTTEGGEENKTMKFLGAHGPNVYVCDMDQDGYEDFTGNSPSAYLVTGYDNLNDFQRQKQAPVIHVFSQKTETGYDEVDDDLVPINPSSILMTAIWDWSDDDFNSASEVVGHYGEQRQVYRHRRYYQPTGSGDTFNDGFPVVVTRNKVRGKGRVLHLRFDGEADHDAHILGWAIHYKATRKI